MTYAEFHKSCELKKTIIIPVTEATSLGSSKALACFYFTEEMNI